MKKTRRHKKYSGVRKRSKGTYEINYYINGARRTETVSADTESAAYAIRIKKLSRSEPIAEDVNISFADALDYYLNNTGKILKANTQKRSVCILNHLINFIDRNHNNVIYVRQVTLDLANQYKNYLLSIPNKTPSGINTDISKLRAIFKKFREYGFILENPFSKVEKIPRRLSKPVSKYLPTDYEIKYILDIVDKDPDYKEITQFLIRIGRRIEETTLYRKADVVTDRNGKPVCIRVRADITKTNEEGKIPLDDELAAIINEALLKNKNVSYLFTNRYKRKISQNTYREYLAGVSSFGGFNRITPHCFRYYVVNKLLNSGVNLKDAMTITGHLDIESFMSYVKTTEEGRQKALTVTRLDSLD